MLKVLPHVDSASKQLYSYPAPALTYTLVMLYLRFTPALLIALFT